MARVSQGWKDSLEIFLDELQILAFELKTNPPDSAPNF
jgi:hypothetical protein